MRNPPTAVTMLRARKMPPFFKLTLVVLCAYILWTINHPEPSDALPTRHVRNIGPYGPYGPYGPAGRMPMRPQMAQMAQQAQMAVQAPPAAPVARAANTVRSILYYPI